MDFLSVTKLMTSLFLLSLMIPGRATADPQGCKGDQDCQDYETCIESEGVCGDLRTNCENPLFCGENITCTVRNHTVVCEEPECRTQNDCPGDQSCSLSKCSDPCEFWVCGDNAVCVTDNHVPSCQCKPGYLWVDPGNVTSGCTECKEHKDCPTAKLCIAGQCEALCQNQPAVCGLNSRCLIQNNHLSCNCFPGYWRVNPSDITSSCENTGERQFYLVSKSMNFQEAEHHCAERGDRLARILNKKENDEAIALIKTKLAADVGHVYIGGKSTNKGARKYWVSPETPIYFTYFHPGQPESEMETCLQFWRKDGVWMWDDTECFIHHPFICETARP